MANNFPSYTSAVFDREKRKTVTAACCKRIEEIALTEDFYALAVIGNSGILGAVVADRLGLDIIVVRKPGVNAHDSSRVNGVLKDGG